MGLQPGNPDGTYVQQVPLVGFLSRGMASIDLGEETVALRFPENYVGVSRHFVPEVDVEDSEVVFVGYGVRAPEYGWDDYKGMDMRGKTLVMLINDPAVPSTDDPSQFDESMFRGEAMTYYGRWTYKYEIASELGADANLYIGSIVTASTSRTLPARSGQ